MEGSCNYGGVVGFVTVVRLAFVVGGVRDGGVVIFQELTLSQSSFGNFVRGDFECGGAGGGGVIEWLAVLMIGGGTVAVPPQGDGAEGSSPFGALSPRRCSRRHGGK